MNDAQILWWCSWLLYPGRAMKRSFRLLIISSALAALTLTVFAQEGTAFVAPSRSVGEYAGVKPGSNNPPPRIARVNRARSKNRGRRATLLTWPGFEQRANGGSRFFLQVSSLIVTEQSSGENRFELILRNSTTHVGNTRRWLETRFFNTPVTRARVERRGRRDLAVVFHLRSNVSPQVSTGPGAGGFHFIFIDFPPGNYAAADTRGADPLPAAPTADDRPGAGLSDDEMRELNEERPPGM